MGLLSSTRQAAVVASLATIMGVLPVLGISCSDYNVSLGEASTELSAEAINFGEVVVGKQSTIGIRVRNVGDGPLTIQSAELDGTTSGDFTLIELTSMQIDKGGEAELRVRYVPDVVGQDYGRVQLATNDPDVPITNVDLTGFGVEPEIDLDPDILWFGEVEAGDSKSLAVTVSSRGTGSLDISSIALSDGLDGEYGFVLPTTVDLPYEMPAGTSMDVVVTFSPESDGELNGELIFGTNDPSAGEASVSLLGNSIDDPTGNEPPVVSISDPNWGEYILTDQEVVVVGVVYDEEDAPENLVCLAYAGSTPIGTGSPDSGGNVSIPTTTLPAGEVEVILRCLDTDGTTGEDSVEVIVWDIKEPIQYVLAPGDSPFAYWFVDDDVSIYLDGRLVFADTNHHTDTHPPVTLDAEIGQEVTVVVTDYNYCDAVVDGLNLHFGTTERQTGTDSFCWSACPEHECFDGTYAGPWPNIVYEASFTISIP